MSIKVLHIQSFDWGGAAKAAIRLHNGLMANGIDSQLMLKWKSKKDTTNVFEFSQPIEKYTFKRKLKNKIKQYKKNIFKEKPSINYLKNAPEGFYQFTIPTSKYDITSSVLVKEADIIHLHWVSDFIDNTSFFSKINKPIVWTLHDMNPFTGGCHYSLDCQKYQIACFDCPQLKDTINPDYSQTILELKKGSLNHFSNLHIVTPSLWLKGCSEKSLLFKQFSHSVIPNGFCTKTFTVRDKKYSREILGLPQEKNILLFVASDINCKPKGYHLIKKALTNLPKELNILMCAVGEKDNSNNDNEMIIELGSFSDERMMSLVYSAADVFVTPSIADNLPNTVVESLLCGTPVVGFRIGGIENMIDNKKNGLLCNEISTEALSKSIIDFFINRNLFSNEQISNQAKSTYSIENIANKYSSLYRNILNKNE